MNVKLVLGTEERQMATNDAVPRVGDIVEFSPDVYAKVIKVRWDLYRDKVYKEGYLTHQAVATLAAVRKAKRR
jgi:hypothetical protein